MENNVAQYLPYYLIHRCIIPYTYELQPKQLLRDIRSFYTDYALLENTYFTMYSSSILFTDLVKFCNPKHRFLPHLSLQYMQILRRHMQLADKTDEYLQQLSLHNVNEIGPHTYLRRSKFLWGLLTPEERTEFINTYIFEDGTDWFV